MENIKCKKMKSVNGNTCQKHWILTTSQCQCSLNTVLSVTFGPLLERVWHQKQWTRKLKSRKGSHEKLSRGKVWEEQDWTMWRRSLPRLAGWRSWKQMQLQMALKPRGVSLNPAAPPPCWCQPRCPGERTVLYCTVLYCTGVQESVFFQHRHHGDHRGHGSQARHKVAWVDILPKNPYFPSFLQ